MITPVKSASANKELLGSVDCVTCGTLATINAIALVA